MTLKREVLMAFGATGAAWVAVSAVFLGDIVLPAFAAVFVIAATALLARADARFGTSMKLVWGGAMLVGIALIVLPGLEPSATPLYGVLLLAVPVGAVLGSLLFALWAVPALAVLFILEGTAAPALPNAD